MQHMYYKLTTPQYDIHVREMVYAKTDVNILYFVIHIDEKIEERQMQQAVCAAIKKHKAVRTRIRLMDQEPYQYFAGAEEFCPGVVELTQQSEEEQKKLYRQWGQTPFTYLNGALFDFKILRLPNDTYGLFCKFHHVWCDGWTTGILWTDILLNYCRIREGKTLPDINEGLPEALIERSCEYAGSRQCETDQRFFREYLKGLEVTGTVKTDQHAGADRSVVFELPQEFTERIKIYCNRWEITPYCVFMAALTVYGCGIASASETVVGMARLNRDTKEARETAGMFVKQVPLRMRVGEGEQFHSLCRKILTESREVSKHKKYPMTEIMNDVQREHGFTGGLISYALSFQREKIELVGYELPVSLWFGNATVCAEPLVVHVIDLMDHGFQVFYDYQKAYFNTEKICYLHDSILNIIYHGMEENVPVTELPLIGDHEQKAISERARETIRPIEKKETILDLFDRQAKRTPDRTAVAGADGVYTYAETGSAGDAVAAQLQGLDIQKEDVIGVMLNRNSNVFFALLGIMKAGGCFVLLDPKYPKERVEAIAKDCAMKYIYTEPGWKEQYGTARNICIDITKPDAFVPVCIEPDQLCYMIYTSGTTGKPKGVQIEHRSLYNLVLPDHSEFMRDVAEHGTMAYAIGAFSFDISLFELFTTVLNGVPVTIATDAEVENPLSLAKRMKEQHVDVLYGTPSRLLSYCEWKEFLPAIQKLKIVLSAGEAFLPSLHDTLSEIHGVQGHTLHIYNGYGPTEATIGTSFQRVTGKDITLGVPMANYKLRCMDQNGRMLPFDTVGELYIGGKGLARGYAQKALTDRAFVTVGNERYYKTGDLVSRRLDGGLNYEGRKDNQIKLRGFRIELEEIEMVMKQHTPVKEVAVILKKGQQHDFICAFYVSKSELSEQQLKEKAEKYLPYYMIPSVMKHMEKLPVNRNGKTDKQLLEQIEIEYQKEYVPAQSKLQKTLTEIAESILGIGKVGIDDNLFDIGANSLNMARYAVEAMAYGLRFHYTDLFKYSTIRAFSSYLEKEKEYADDEIQNYGYEGIRKMLAGQTGELTAKRRLKYVFLTGATGYLGIHVMNALLEQKDTILYCLVRGKGKITPVKKLNAKLFYYFEKSLFDYEPERIHILEGDLNEVDLIALCFTYPIDTVIHCAADVSHYTHGGSMKKINTDSVKQLVELCKYKQAEIIHVSTISVGQFRDAGTEHTQECFTEKDFYFGQNLENQYLRTKFLAERIVLNEMEQGTLQGKIVRVGNLQGRYVDGEFQINFKTNAFTTRLRTYVKLGFIPAYIWNEAVDYSPIDYAADAICLIAGYHMNQQVFHMMNDKKILYQDIFECLEEHGYPLEKLSKEEYEERVKRILSDAEERFKLSDIAADLTTEMEELKEVQVTSTDTTEILTKAGFTWPVIDKNYLIKYTDKIQQLGVFDFY